MPKGLHFCRAPDGVAILAKSNVGCISQVYNVKGYTHNWYTILGVFMVGEFN